MDFCYFSLLEFETQLCEDFGNLANHGFPPPPDSCILFYESSVFLFASVSDRMSTVCPEKKLFFSFNTSVYSVQECKRKLYFGISFQTFKIWLTFWPSKISNKLPHCPNSFCSPSPPIQHTCSVEGGQHHWVFCLSCSHLEFELTKMINPTSTIRL